MSHFNTQKKKNPTRDLLAQRDHIIDSGSTASELCEPQTLSLPPGRVLHGHRRLSSLIPHGTPPHPEVWG